MKKSFLSPVAAGLALSAALLMGCGKSEPESAAPKTAASKPTAPLIDVADVDWCKEHFVPESICVQCHPDLADSFKKKNDWCTEHNVPDSQCFKHHPELKEKFAAAFKAKYGKEPPTDAK